MKRMINYRSIDQFRTVVKNVQHRCAYIGQDENDNAVYHPSPDYPVITATATEKIHGSNGAVCYNKQLGFWVQSRKSIIEPGKDNAACAFNCMTVQDE